MMADSVTHRDMSVAITLPSTLPSSHISHTHPSPHGGVSVWLSSALAMSVQEGSFNLTIEKSTQAFPRGIGFRPVIQLQIRL